MKQERRSFLGRSCGLLALAASALLSSGPRSRGVPGTRRLGQSSADPLPREGYPARWFTQADHLAG